MGIKTFKTLDIALDELNKDFKNSDYLKLVTSEYLRLVGATKNIPIQTEALMQSAFSFSDIETGRVEWNTPYAEKVYKHNVTGVSEWDIVTWEEYSNDFEKLVAKAIDNDLWK